MYTRADNFAGAGKSKINIKRLNSLGLVKALLHVHSIQPEILRLLCANSSPADVMGDAHEQYVCHGFRGDNDSLGVWLKLVRWIQPSRLGVLKTGELLENVKDVQAPLAADLVLFNFMVCSGLHPAWFPQQCSLYLESSL